MAGQKRRQRKQNINIFTFRWYLVFFNFLIRGSAAKIATVTNAHWTHHCVSNAHWTPLIDDMPRIPSRSGQDMPSDPLIHGIITNICDIIIYKRGTVSVSYPMRGYRGRYLPCLQRDTHIFDPPFQPVQKPSKNQKIYHLAVFSAKFRPIGPKKAEQERGRCVFGLY